MAHLVVVCFGQIVHGCTGSYHAVRNILHAKPLERGGVEMTQQQFFREIFGKHPVVESIQVMLFAKEIGKLAAFVFLDDDFAGLKALQQLVDIFRAALGSIKFAGRNIQKGDTGVAR